METTKDMTAELSAERSLEIIQKNIEQSQKDASKSMGNSLLVIGLLKIGMAIVVGIISYATWSYMAYWLWLTLPFILWAMKRWGWIDREQSPTSIIDSMIKKTWRTFAEIVTAFFIFSMVFNYLLAQTETVEVYSRVHISILPVILLLMGMAIAMIGHILKSRWMVILGIAGGVKGFVFQSLGWPVLFLNMGWFSDDIGLVYFYSPCIDIALFSLIGLVLPGIILKRR